MQTATLNTKPSANGSAESATKNLNAVGTTKIADSDMTIKPINMYRVTVQGRTRLMTEDQVLNLHTTCSQLVTQIDGKNIRERIIRAVCEHFSITRERMMSKKRPHRIAYPRQVAMYFMRELTDDSLQSVAEHFGKGNHGTVMHAERTVRNLMSTEEAVRLEIEKLRKAICTSNS